MAETYPNSYIIAVFACCRQLYDPSWMIGTCLSYEEALQKSSEAAKELKQMLFSKKNIKELGKTAAQIK